MVVSILVVMGAAQGTPDPASLHASGWLLLVSGRFANCYREDGQRVRAPSVGGVKGVAAASSLCSPGNYTKSSSCSISSPESRRAPDLPSSWAGQLWVPYDLTVSSILASGCLDQVHFSHVIQTVCFAIYFLIFLIHC